ncbi:Imm1 family immunity protein [Kribbella catacumbae]|uniref:Imm1 family immunity protein n=1 Tax=Kribbella catacumbae TaxID=460086 RepID=UPI00036CAFCC|nr:Imm1 family immunity protein [Kribbella catacumbae]
MTYTADAYYLAEHDDDPVRLSSAEDVDALVDALLAGTLAHSVAAVYLNERPTLEGGFPDHELRIAVFAELKVGGIRYTQRTSSWYLKGQSSQRDEVAYSYMNNREGFPADSETDTDTIRQVAKEFLALGGERPHTGEWIEWPPRLF